MTRPIQKLLLPLALILPVGLGTLGWLAMPALGQEPQATVQALSLDGSWIEVSPVTHTKKLYAINNRSRAIVFNGPTMTRILSEPDKATGADHIVDSTPCTYETATRTMTPNELTWHYKYKGSTRTVLAIYKLDKDELTICYCIAEEGNPYTTSIKPIRPTAFEINFGVSPYFPVEYYHRSQCPIQLDATRDIAATESAESLKAKAFGLAGFTYKIDGNDHYLVSRGQSVVVRTSPGRTNGIRPCPGLGPNKCIVSGLFKFIGNEPGTNGYGATVNIEVYEPFTDEEILIVAPNSHHAKIVTESRASGVSKEDAARNFVTQENARHAQLSSQQAADERDAMYRNSSKEQREILDREKAMKLRKKRAREAAWDKGWRGQEGLQPKQVTPPVDKAHKVRKARAAYLIEYITRTGAEIDRLVSSGQNPMNYWRAIVEAQNELLNIYKVELRNACNLEDESAIRILKSNIDKLTRGREFVWNAIRGCQ